MFRNKQFFIYAAALAALFLLLRWMDYRLLVIDHAFEVYMGVLAVVFTLLGIWIALKLARPKVEIVVVEKQVFINAPEAINTTAIDKLNLSKRELEVLTLMSRGMSNQEISEALFVSLNTVKTHTSRLFEKMEVKRRTQAVDLAKRLGIIG